MYTSLQQINWQERCLELQLELHRSKNQAGRIRDMLREKVSVIISNIIIQKTLVNRGIEASYVRFQYLLESNTQSS